MAAAKAKASRTTVMTVHIKVNKAMGTIKTILPRDKAMDSRLMISMVVVSRIAHTLLRDRATNHLMIHTSNRATMPLIKASTIRATIHNAATLPTHLRNNTKATKTPISNNSQDMVSNPVTTTTSNLDMANSMDMEHDQKPWECQALQGSQAVLVKVSAA